eukprot:10859-Alexandrium_andersonii.AAC.1
MDSKEGAGERRLPSSRASWRAPRACWPRSSRPLICGLSSRPERLRRRARGVGEGRSDSSGARERLL